ncbi:hypothetical protein AB0E62_16705 [Streptomyces sp. NPDC038707]|uniref:hypothetical protein n=1 Tax=unclassified Streptomyces TaxID=2593676 RepID=UPI003404D05A
MAQPAGMRLNHLADPGGGGAAGGRLTSSSAEKQAAANSIERDIEPGTRTAGAWADGETDAAVKAFGAKDGDGWLTSKAVQTMHKTWGEQVKNLMTLLAQDKGALRAADTTLQGTDAGVGAATRRPSVFDQYSPPPQH